MNLKNLSFSALASFLLVVACDAEEPVEASPRDAVQTDEEWTEDDEADEPFECGVLGKSCEGGCAEDWWCHGQHPFIACVPDQAWCGGAANLPCPEEHPICGMFAHGAYGTCFSQDQIDCLCARSPNAMAAEVCASESFEPSM